MIARLISWLLHRPLTSSLSRVALESMPMPTRRQLRQWRRERADIASADHRNHINN